MWEKKMEKNARKKTHQFMAEKRSIHNHTQRNTRMHRFNRMNIDDHDKLISNFTEF